MRQVKAIPISEARANLTALVEQATQSREPRFIASRSKVKAVLLGADAYHELIEQLEDLEDSLDILKARLAGEPTRPLEEFIQELNAGPERGVRRRA